MNAITYIRRRHPAGFQRTLARERRCDQAELVSRGLLRLASCAEPPASGRITDLAYLEGAKADVLRALAEGSLREAREALQCWRALHRAIYGRRGRA